MPVMRTAVTLRRMVSAPAGATVLGSVMAVPRGCARAGGGSVNRSRSRPGWSLDGTICWARASAGVPNMASAAASRHRLSLIVTPRKVWCCGELRRPGNRVSIELGGVPDRLPAGVDWGQQARFGSVDPVGGNQPDLARLAAPTGAEIDQAIGLVIGPGLLRAAVRRDAHVHPVTFAGPWRGRALPIGPHRLGLRRAAATSVAIPGSTVRRPAQNKAKPDVAANLNILVSPSPDSALRQGLPWGFVARAGGMVQGEAGFFSLSSNIQIDNFPL